MAKNNISEWSIVPGNNLDLGGISVAEGWLPSTVNNFEREEIAQVAKFYDDFGGQNTVGGTADVITITTTTTYTTLSSGIRFVFKAGGTNTTAVTLNLDTIGAKAVRKISGGTDIALAAGDILSGKRQEVIYDSTANAAAGAWILTSVPDIAANNPAVTGDMTITYSDNGAAVGPTLDLFRNSASPAVNDILGAVQFDGKDSAGNNQTYARIIAVITDPVSTTEDGSLILQVTINGSFSNVFILSPTVATITIDLTPAVNGGSALGSASNAWSNLFLANGGVINWNNGDVTITHSTNLLAFGGAASGYTFDAVIKPATNDGAALGTSALAWSDADFATGAVIRFANTETITHASGLFTSNANLTISKATPVLLLTKPASGTAITIGGTTAGNSRFTMSLGNATAESGSDVGSDFSINRHSDAGTFVDSPIAIVRSSGLITLARGQLAFPATQNASTDPNTLDDYEEGSWTPADGSGAALSFVSVSAFYVKVGRLVSAWGSLSYPVTASGSAAIISGLPFTSTNAGYGQAGGYISYNGTANARFILVLQNSTTAGIYTATGSGTTNLQMSSQPINFNLIYVASA